MDDKKIGCKERGEKGKDLKIAKERIERKDGKEIMEN